MLKTGAEGRWPSAPVLCGATASLIPQRAIVSVRAPLTTSFEGKPAQGEGNNTLSPRGEGWVRGAVPVREIPLFGGLIAQPQGEHLPQKRHRDTEKVISADFADYADQT